MFARSLSALFVYCGLFGCLNTEESSKHQKWLNECLDRHNYYRELEGMPHLKLDRTTMFFAQKSANNLSNKCGFQIDKDSPFGENIAGGNMSCIEVIDRWYKQKAHFTQSAPEASKAAGQYTQLVWRSSTFLGCGLATHCEYRFVTVCYYFPPGNIKDEYEANLPVAKQTTTTTTTTTTTSSTSESSESSESSE